MPPAEHKDTPTFAEEGMTTKELAAKVRDLENALAATRAGMPLSLIPDNGAGPGTEIEATWSQYQQEQVRSEQAHNALEREIHAR